MIISNKVLCCCSSSRNAKK